MSSGVGRTLILPLALLALAATAVRAEEDARACEFCEREMARVEGTAGFSAHYVCRACSAVVHVDARGHRTASLRVQGERRSFALEADEALDFPLPGARCEEPSPAAEEDEAQGGNEPESREPRPLPRTRTADRPDLLHQTAPRRVVVEVPLGHPVTLSGHPIGLPGHPVARPGHPVGRPGHPVGRPGDAVTLPGNPVERPAPAVERPGHPVTRAAPAVHRPASPVERSGHPVVRSSHPVSRSASPIRRAPAPARSAPARARLG